MATLKLSESSQIEISTFKSSSGEKYLNVRKMFKTKNSDDWQPTKQGISIPEAKVMKLIKRMKDEFESIEDAEELEPRKGKDKTQDKTKKSKSED